MLINPAGSITKFLPLFEREEKKTVIDYGSGNLRNSIYLHRRGYKVYAVDLPSRVRMKPLPNLTCVFPEELKRLNLTADVVLCTFVLNQMNAKERDTFVRIISRKLCPGGYLLVETKGFLLNELDMMFIPKGFTRIHNQKGRYTVIVLYKYLGKT